MAKKRKKEKSIRIPKYKNSPSDAVIELRKYIIVLVGIVVIFLGLYIFTGKIVTKDMDKDNTDTIKVEIGYDEILMGNILNRNYTNYMVLIYNVSFDSDLANLYNTYSSKENVTKMFYVDLSKKFNSQYYNIGTKTTIPEDIKDIKVGDYTLFYINAGSITKVITNREEIVKILS